MQSPAAVRSPQERSLEWLTLTFAGVIVLGAYVNAWARQSVGPPYRSWPDAVIDIGWLSVTTLLTFTAVRNLASGASWRRALPAGYHLSLIGCALFGVGLLGDRYYREATVVLNGLEDLFAPTRVLQVAGAAIIVTAPLRRAIHMRQGYLSWPAVVSASLFLAVVRFDLLWADPLVYPWPAIHDNVAAWWVNQNLGTAALQIESLCLAAIVAYLFSRFELWPGTLSMLCCISGGLSCLVQMRYQLYPVMALTGFAADGMVWAARDRHSSRSWIQGLAASVSVTHVLLYWIAIDLLVGGDAWSPKLWLGELLTAALTGWLAGVLVSQVAIPDHQASAAPAGTDPVTANEVRAALSKLTEDLSLEGSDLAVRLAAASGDADRAATRLSGQHLRDRLTGALREMTQSAAVADAEAARVVEALYVHGLSGRQVEQRFHLSRATVYRRVARGMALLAARMQAARDMPAQDGEGRGD
jgi:hypothetical protein